MRNRKKPRTLAKEITIGILFLLVGINAAWAIIGDFSGPLIALFFYASITFLCWRRNHFQAGIIGGVLGLSIHIYELLFQDAGILAEPELSLFFANIVLPIPLLIFSYKAHKEAGAAGPK